MNWTWVKLSDLNKHRYMRLDAKYWIQKSLLKKKRKKKKNDNRQYMVLSNNGAGKFSDYLLVQLIEFAEDMRGRPADDKQKPLAPGDKSIY